MDLFSQMAAPEWDAIDLLPLLESLGLCTQVCVLVALFMDHCNIITKIKSNYNRSLFCSVNTTAKYGTNSRATM